MRVRLGLAAWSNTHFDNALFHPGTRHDQYLPRYAGLFDCTEADVLHHRYPDRKTLQDWVDQTPDGFTFLPKMHKRATHEGDDEAAVAWLRGLEPLRDANRLGPVLLQFPPSLQRDKGWDLVERLLRKAGLGTFAVEVRHTSWFVPAFQQMLEDHEAILAWSTFPGAFAPPWATGQRGYIRFTGRHTPKRGRQVTVAERSHEVSEIATRLRQASWSECFAIVTNPFEGNAVDSLPKVTQALGLAKLHARMAREPGRPLLADEPGVPSALRGPRLGIARKA